MASECTFCRKMANLDNQRADQIVWKFPTSVALLAPWQVYHGYCILAYRLHATELSQLGDEDRLNFLDEMCLLAQAVEKAFQPKKLNYEMLGNQTPHMHWHAIWVALDKVKDNSEARQQFKAGPTKREETIATLQKQLRALHAPGGP
jgi:diadenosine tetraphosphate (Ap4A) HIT family hydrolase